MSLRFRCVAFIVVLAGGLAVARADLSAIRAEPNLEKRARLALENADGALRSAENAYDKRDLGATQASVAEMRQSVELAENALAGTGKNPVRSPKHFKNAEVKSRELLKRLESFERSMDFEDRKLVEAAREKIQEIHEEWLLGIMGHKR